MLNLSPGPNRTYIYGVYCTVSALILGGCSYVEGLDYKGLLITSALAAIWTAVRFTKEQRHSR
jgi:hypothetical protein